MRLSFWDLDGVKSYQPHDAVGWIACVSGDLGGNFVRTGDLNAMLYTHNRSFDKMAPTRR
jgi:hypothetical protein